MSSKKEENRLVTKANDLIEASFSLTIGEQKIILYLASMVQPNDEEFKRYKIKVSEFIRLLGVKNQSKYQEIKKITRELLSKTFTIRKTKSYLQLNWLSSAEYFDGEGIVELEFSPKLKPYLMGLKERFTSYQLKNIIQLKCVYSPRIYELLKQYQRIGERTFTVAELKEILCIGPNEYKKYNDFKRFVILKAQKELQAKTDLYFEFEELKKSRKIEKIRFIIHRNDKFQFEQLEIFPEDKNNNNALIDKMVNEFGVHPKTAKELVATHDEDRILNNLYITQQKAALNEIKKGIAEFAVAAIKNDYRHREPKILDKINEENKTKEDKYKNLYLS